MLLSSICYDWLILCTIPLDAELKAKIQAFKAEKKGKKPIGGGEGEGMDTSAG